MKPLVSVGSVLVAGVVRATLLTTAWGQSDDATDLAASALNYERRTYNGTGIYRLQKDDRSPDEGFSHYTGTSHYTTAQ